MSIAEDEKKRKPRTSSAVKNRYAKKTYTQIRVNLRKDLAARLDEKLVRDGKTRAGWLRECAERYLGNEREGEED